VEAHLLKKGAYLEVYTLVDRGRAIYEQELSEKISVDTKEKIIAYIDFLADTKPPIRSAHISKKLAGHSNLYELRPKNVRLFYFMIGNWAIITHGFVKKGRKTPKEEIQRAEKLKSRYQSED
jgi:phage-related protein